ncbi:protein-export chaperone SecB [Denitratisoma sp. agr-D3]
MSEQQQPVFSIEKLYVKDLSLEVPNAPFIFMEQEAPAIEVQIQNNGNAVGEGMYEVVLTVTVTAKNGDKGYFLVEAAQAGIFRIEGVPEESIEPIMAIACPNVLFPYARETVSDAVNRAGFPPVILAPVNFEAIYQQRQAEQAAAGEIPIQ